MNEIENTSPDLTKHLQSLRQQAAALDQAAMPFIAAGRLLESYGRLTFEQNGLIAELQAKIKNTEQKK